ncbi:uncharacterized protein I206_102637 [Kwoniella pini CBS 10737]|uniref:DNA replication regulator SLD2 n=1 Tax=Kwoniella pini CBS 10737 TaxID=1296096 RepID=A0A1B9I5Z0_9TREE|nr:uncharacterized protein I206_02990 [Kwoniella pini CBS 10737]OCF50928.1 hypothetical protein I206_02990 [Kwoniella pini CBS 10737]
MDLATVKASVKAWEKSFRAREGRNPEKEDIKSDKSDIASQYALYRKLTKATASSQHSSSSSSRRLSSHSLQLPSSSTAAPSSSSSSQYRSTPRNVQISEYPTTPTPPARRVNGLSFGNSQAGPSRSISNGSSATNGSEVTEKSLKRKASKSILSNSSPPQPSTSSITSTSRTLFSTPKKKGYIGPIHDPNPINPFTTSSPSKSPFPTSNGLQREKSFSSPFIHASSPKKLKEVLEANSLSKIKERNNVISEITPRTRARKRLKGEQVDDTPLKEKLPKRRRGQGKSEEPLEITAIEEERYFDPTRGIFDEENLEDEEEDELGPSPMKPLGQGKGFTSLFREAEVRRNELAHSRIPINGSSLNTKTRINEKVSSSKVKDDQKDVKQNGIASFFNRTAKSATSSKTLVQKEDKMNSPVDKDVPSIQVESPPVLKYTPSTEEVPSLEETVPRLDLPKSPAKTPSTSQRRRDKVLNLNDDDDDEDGIGQIRIVPTRRQIKKRNNFISDDSGSDDNKSQYQIENYEHEFEKENQDELIDIQEEKERNDQLNSIITFSSDDDDDENKEIQIPSIKLLSINSSPFKIKKIKTKAFKNKEKLKELKIKAIFNPLIASSELKAFKKGQNIEFTGQSRLKDDNFKIENDLIDKFHYNQKDNFNNNNSNADDNDNDNDDNDNEEEDDDWESESDGWKREEIEEDW